MRLLDEMVSERLVQQLPWATALYAVERQTLLRLLPYCTDEAVFDAIITLFHRVPTLV